MEKGTLHFDFNNMFTDICGEQGISTQELLAAAAQMPAVHAALEAKRPQMAWRRLPYDQADVVAACELAAEEIRSQFDAFVVLGIGGSALGSKALFGALCHPHYNALAREQRKGPRFYVEDNVDPDRLSALLDVIEPKHTAFHIITKSGDTVETMSQFIWILDLLQQSLGADFTKNVYITTDKESGIMKKIARQQGWDTFTVPDGVGGRFSVLCPVGLLSAAVLGLDMPALLAGAAAMDAACSQADWQQNPAYLYALLYTVGMQKGMNISVLLPYVDALAPTADWYCQLWAESLGKAKDIAGKLVNAGQTPVRALGVTDQHSQIQLYNEGPFDKIISFIGVERFRTELRIPKAPIDVLDASYLCGQSFNRLISAEMHATRYAVTQHGKANNLIMLSTLNAYTYGKLLFFFELATAAAGELLRINAFDQPGVEAGKIATFALMGRPGYEETAKQLTDAHPGEAAFTYEV